MGIKIDKKRGVETDAEGNIWAYNTEKFVNGDNQPTERTVKNQIKKKDIKIMREELTEKRERFHKSKSHIENFKSTIKTKEYIEFKDRIKSGDLKNLFDCYVQENFLTDKIKQDKKIKSIDHYLVREEELINQALDELNDYETQIKQVEEVIKNGKK